MSSSDEVRILFRYLVTMTGEEYENGEIRISGDTIHEIRPEVSPEFSGKTIDQSACLILPGFVNAHCHLSLSGLAGKIFPGTLFTPWVDQVVTENKALPWADRIEALHREAQVLLRSGVTTLGDYLSHPELLVEYANLPFRQVLFVETLGFNPKVAKERADEVEAILKGHPSSKKSFLRLGVAPHAPYSVSPELFRRLRGLAQRYSCPMSCHVAEVPEEIEFLETGGGDLRKLLQAFERDDENWQPPGTHPVDYLDQLGQFPLQAVHLNYLDEEIPILAQRGGTAAFCPGSTRWFGRKQWMPVRKLLDYGVTVGLGTDSLASNESLNFLRELRIAEEMLPDIHRKELLDMATRGGATTLSLDSGTLAPGKPADLIGFKWQKNSENWFDVPFGPERLEVDFTMIAGQISPSAPIE